MNTHEKGLDLLEALEYIDPVVLDYDQWLAVGMGLKEAGYSASVWGGLVPPGWQAVSQRRMPTKMEQLQRFNCRAGHRRHGRQDGHGRGLAARVLSARP